MTTDPTPPDRSEVATQAPGLLHLFRKQNRRSFPGAQGSSGPKTLVLVLLAGVVGVVIFLFVHHPKGGGIRPGVTTAHAGCPKGQRDCLPDLSYIDTTGAAYPRDSLIGKVVLVNFWATWCHPCEKEIPDLSKAYQKYKGQGVVFLGILIDNPDSQALLNFQSDHDMTYPVVRANRDLMASYDNPDAYPTTFVYDRSGKQVYNHLGQVRESELDALLATLAAPN